MQLHQNYLLPAFVVALLLVGSPFAGDQSDNSVQAQTRRSAAQQSRASFPTIKLRDRGDVQAHAATSQPALLPMARQASAGSWPGPQRSVHTQSRPMGSTSNTGYNINTGRIQQTSSQAPFALPSTGPIILGSHRKRLRDFVDLHRTASPTRNQTARHRHHHRRRKVRSDYEFKIQSAAKSHTRGRTERVCSPRPDWKP